MISSIDMQIEALVDVHTQTTPIVLPAGWFDWVSSVINQ